jgi:hypothetical protein
MFIVTSEGNIQIEREAARLVRLLTKGWVAHRITVTEDGLPEIGSPIELGPEVVTARVVTHVVMEDGEVLDEGTVTVPNDPT